MANDREWTQNDNTRYLVALVVTIAVMFAIDAMAVALVHGTKPTPGPATPGPATPKPGPFIGADLALLLAGWAVAWFGAIAFALALSAVVVIGKRSMNQPGTGLTRKRLLWMIIGTGMMFAGITVSRFVDLTGRRASTAE